jgi:hypothetical protein
MENKIICPDCGFSSLFPIFYCIRCKAKLLKNETVDGKQITLEFEGGVNRTLAIYYHGLPLQPERINVESERVWLHIRGQNPLEGQTSDLFKVLYKGEELWDLDQSFLRNS